ILNTLKSGASASTSKKRRNMKVSTSTSQSFKSKEKELSTNKNNINNSDIIDIDEDVTTESPRRSPLNKIFINTPEKSSVVAKCALSDESDSVNCLLDITKKVLEQNTSIMEKQNALEGILTQLTESVKTLRLSCENLKSKAKGNDGEWWQKGATRGIKIAVDNWLYPNDKIYEQAIKKELEALCPDKMEQYQKVSKWEALFSKIENLISTESCKYCGALFGSFRCSVFEYVFKKKISPTVNSESSKAEIASWKLSKEVQWCFENLDTLIEEDDKTYLQMVAKRVFGRQLTRNNYARNDNNDESNHENENSSASD
ncbi:901_t:CDS:2, partial [Gigaspora rosea]